ncbi:MAG: hypothetical protein JNK85_24965 [Verrucomicrobiales bacterium]|nr:hypothetical protein [Verrucomicrobiales bacterium]
MSDAERNGLAPEFVLGALGRFSPKAACRQLRGWFRLRVLDRPLSRLRQPMGQLLSEGRRVESTTRELETRFLSIGADIETMASLSGDLVSRSERLLALATGQSSGEDVLSSAIEELRRPVEFLEDSRLRWAEIVSRLREHLRLVGEVRRMETCLERAVAPLRFIQTFFRIESAILPAEVQHVFSSLTQDIGELHHRVVDLFSEQFLSLRKAEVTVEALVKRLEVQLRLHESLVKEKKKLIEDAMVNLKQMLEENRAVDIRLTGTTRDIDRDVGRIVTSLQFQDITRQKLEHVTEAIGRMTSDFRALEGRGSAESRGPAREGLGRLNETSRIQVAQLDAVCGDLAKAETEITEAVHGIHQRAGTLDEECITLRNFRSISVSQDGVVQVVLNTLEEVRALTATMLTVHTDTYETIKPLESLTSNLTDVMRNLSNNIRLIALNAQIQATQVGEGTGLEVLSQRTCTISDEANAVNERAAVELDRLTAGFERMVHESRELRELIDGEQRWLSDQGSRLEARLHEYRDSTLEVFREVDELAAKLRDHTQTCQEHLDFAARAAEELQPLRDLLQTVATASESWKPQRTAGRDRESSDSTYTMQAEREVHRAVLTGAAAPVAVAVTDASAGSLDMFEDFGVAQPGNPTVEPSPPSLDAAKTASHETGTSEPSVVPIRVGPASPPSTSLAASEPLTALARGMAPVESVPSPRPGVESPPPAPAGNLGDNVELF